MSPEQVAGWFLNLFTAILVAWVTAWFYSRRETDRLLIVWKRERRQAELESLKKHIKDFLQVSTQLAVRLYGGEKSPGGGKLMSEEEATLSALQSLVAAAAIAYSIGDPALAERINDFKDQTRRMGDGDKEAWGAAQKAAGKVLERCGELLEATAKSEPWFVGGEVARFVRQHERAICWLLALLIVGLVVQLILAPFV